MFPWLKEDIKHSLKFCDISFIPMEINVIFHAIFGMCKKLIESLFVTFVWKLYHDCKEL